MGLDQSQVGLMIIPGLLGQLSQIFIGLTYTSYFQKICQSSSNSNLDSDSPKSTSNTTFSVSSNNSINNDNNKTKVEMIVIESDEGIETREGSSVIVEKKYEPLQTNEPNLEILDPEENI